MGKFLLYILLGGFTLSGGYLADQTYNHGRLTKKVTFYIEKLYDKTVNEWILGKKAAKSYRIARSHVYIPPSPRSPHSSAYPKGSEIDRICEETARDLGEAAADIIREGFPWYLRPVTEKIADKVEDEIDKTMKDGFGKSYYTPKRRWKSDEYERRMKAALEGWKEGWKETERRFNKAKKFFEGLFQKR